jgi:hypothetical protein
MDKSKDHVEETENLEQQRSRDKSRDVEATLDRNAVKGRTLDPSPSQRAVQPSDKTRRSE